MKTIHALLATLWLAGSACAQTPADPFPDPIPVSEGAIRVDFAEFAAIPDIDGGAARMMNLVDEPGTRRMFVNDMRGPIYSVSYDGRTVTRYVDIDAPEWGVGVQSMGRERGFQNFAFHPQFNQAGTPGYGKFYTYTDTGNMQPAPDFTPAGATAAPTHDTVLLEWTARTPEAAVYDGGAPRELFRLRQPFSNHNGGHAAFDPTAAPGDPEYGLLYIGVADGGSGGDPLNLAQDLGSAFGKVLRIDPLGNNGANGKYGIPAGNPFLTTPGALPEIFVYGVRNPQRFAWDTASGEMFLADIGQNTIEEISPAPPGGNLGWNVWEGSYRYAGRQGVELDGMRADPEVVYPVAEYAQADPLFQAQSAAGGLVVYRDDRIPQLTGLLIFADMPSGEILYIDVDAPSNGGQDAIRRILLNDAGAPKTLLELIRAKNAAQGKQPAGRSDLRISSGPENRIFLLNKSDGTIRELVP